MSLNVSRSGMLSSQAQLSTTADNLSNLSTPGFQRSFSHQLSLARTGGATIHSTSLDSSPGPLKSTDRPLDLSIRNRGYFRVTKDGSESYVRSGRFFVDGAGNLVHGSSGGRLTGEKGPIRIDEVGSVDDINVQSDGDVVVERTNGRTDRVDTIPLFGFANQSGLSRSKRGGLVPAENSGDPQRLESGPDRKIMSGRLEMSNVSFVGEITDQQRLLRSFQLNSRAFQVQNEIYQRLTTLL